MSAIEAVLRPGAGITDAALFRSIFERALDGIAIVAPDGTYIEQNEAHARLTGLSAAALQGLTPAVHLGDATFARIFERLEADGHFFGEVDSTNADGVVRQVELSAFAVKDGEQRVLAYVGVKRDVSERRSAEREMQRRFAQLDAIYRMTAAIAQAPDLEAILDHALDCLAETIRPDRASVLLSDDDGVMRFRAWRGISPAYRRRVEGHSPWAPDEPQPSPVMIADVAAELPAGDLRTAILGEGIAAAAFVPLVASGALIGKFMLYFDAPRRLEPEALRLAETVAGHIAIAIERRRDEEALARREREFEALAENSPDIICRFDRQLRHLYVNRAIECVTGQPRAGVLGRTNEELGMPAPLVGRWNAMLRQVFATGQPAETEFEFDTPSGTRQYQSRATVEVEADGVVLTVLATTRDITLLKRAEARQRVLAEIGAVFAEATRLDAVPTTVARLVAHSVAGGCIIDLARADGSLERVATAARDARRAALLDELAELAPVQPGRPGAAEAYRTRAALLLDDLGDAWLRANARSDQEYSLWRSLRLSGAICAPLSANGRTIGTLTLLAAQPEPAYTAEDMEFATELAARIALGLDNLRLFHASTAANRAKSDFMATMSHELRTPLNAIMGYADLLHMHVAGPLTDAQGQQLERIRASANHLLTLIEEILTFSRAEAGKETVLVERFDAGELARECGRMVEAAAHTKGLDFVIELPDAPLPVESDPVKLRQVLLNLLSNAVKFTDAGTVVLAGGALPGAGVRFAVTDTGCGIAPEHQEKVFEAFWQAQSGATRRSGGTGLGLTVCRQLIALLGGELRLESAPGRGCRFEVRLP